MEKSKSRLDALEEQVGAISTQIGMLHSNLLDLSVMTSTIAATLVDKEIIGVEELRERATHFQKEMQEMMQAASPDAAAAKEAIKDIDIAGL